MIRRWLLVPVPDLVHSSASSSIFVRDRERRLNGKRRQGPKIQACDSPLSGMGHLNSADDPACQLEPSLSTQVCNPGRFRLGLSAVEPGP